MYFFLNANHLYHVAMVLRQTYPFILINDRIYLGPLSRVWVFNELLKYCQVFSVIYKLVVNLTIVGDALGPKAVQGKIKTLIKTSKLVEIQKKILLMTVEIKEEIPRVGKCCVPSSNVWSLK